VISSELEAEILRLHHAERWPVGTIAFQLGIHHSAVERVLTQAEVPKPALVRPSIVDPYIPFMLETLKKYPKLTASRLFHMVKERGFRGRPSFFRSIVARIRPRPPAEAYLRLKTLPGEEAQVDWGHFGKILVGAATRMLMAFVMVLSYSRAIFLRFYLGQHLSNFLRGHVDGFGALHGIPRVVLVDNLKSAVLERVGSAIHFHPTILELSAHYRFEVRPVGIARGNEKGRVERAIRFIRERFFAAREFRDLGDLNRQAAAWTEGEAMERPWPESPSRTVRDAFEEEKSRLRPLPEVPFPTEERLEVSVGKTPYVRFDSNDYSIPHELVSRTLVVLADLDRVRVLSGNEVVATHLRSFDKGRQVEDPEHIQALERSKKAARKGRGLDRLAHAAPSSRRLLEELAERGANLGSAVSFLLKLLDVYGGEALEVAISEAVESRVPHPHAVRQALERRWHADGKPAPLSLELPPRVRDLSVKPHSLESYDEIKEKNHEDSH